MYTMRQHKIWGYGMISAVSKRLRVISMLNKTLHFNLQSFDYTFICFQENQLISKKATHVFLHSQLGLLSKQGKNFPSGGELERVGFQHAVHLYVQRAMGKDTRMVAFDEVQAGLALPIDNDARKLIKIDKKEQEEMRLVRFCKDPSYKFESMPNLNNKHSSYSWMPYLGNNVQNFYFHVLRGRGGGSVKHVQFTQHILRQRIEPYWRHHTQRAR